MSAREHFAVVRDRRAERPHDVAFGRGRPSSVCPSQPPSQPAPTRGLHDTNSPLPLPTHASSAGGGQGARAVPLLGPEAPELTRLRRASVARAEPALWAMATRELPLRRGGGAPTAPAVGPSAPKLPRLRRGGGAPTAPAVGPSAPKPPRLRRGGLVEAAGIEPASWNSPTHGVDVRVSRFVSRRLLARERALFRPTSVFLAALPRGAVARPVCWMTSAPGRRHSRRERPTELNQAASA